MYLKQVFLRRRRHLIEIYAIIKYKFIGQDKKIKNTRAIFCLKKNNNKYYWEEILVRGMTPQFSFDINEVIPYITWMRDDLLKFDFHETHLEPKNAIQEK